MLRGSKNLAFALMIGLAMVYGSPGNAYASSHETAALHLSADLITQIETAMALPDPAATPQKLMQDNPDLIDLIAAYVLEKHPERAVMVAAAVQQARLIIKIETAVASPDLVAALQKLMQDNPDLADQIAAYLLDTYPEIMPVIVNANIAWVKKDDSPPSSSSKTIIWNTVENPSTMSNTNL